MKMKPKTEMSLGDRMKSYESEDRLISRIPVIIRVDGRCFHTFTRGFNKPWDYRLIDAMDATAKALVNQIEGAEFAYVQSDEISILVTDYLKGLYQEPWFGYKLQKVVSVSAAIASVEFTLSCGKQALFDSRAYNVPENDVANYFLWRQQDWMRNSVQMLARSMFSHKELHGKGITQLKQMCAEKGNPWEEIPEELRMGRYVDKDGVFAAKDFKTCFHYFDEVNL